MNQHYLKTDYTLHLRCHLIARRDPHRSIIHVHTPFVNIMGGSDVRNRQFTATYLKQFLWYKTRGNNTVNLDNYLEVCDNIMCTAGSNNNCDFSSFYFIKWFQVRCLHRPQEGVSRSRGGSLVTIATWMGKRRPKTPKLIHFLLWQGTS